MAIMISRTLGLSTQPTYLAHRFILLETTVTSTIPAYRSNRGQAIVVLLILYGVGCLGGSIAVATKYFGLVLSAEVTEGVVVPSIHPPLQWRPTNPQMRPRNSNSSSIGCSATISFVDLSGDTQEFVIDGATPCEDGLKVRDKVLVIYDPNAPSQVATLKSAYIQGWHNCLWLSIASVIFFAAAFLAARQISK